MTEQLKESIPSPLKLREMAVKELLGPVIHQSTTYDSEKFIQAATHYLGFRRVTENARIAFKSAINSAIRLGILDYEGSNIWRES